MCQKIRVLQADDHAIVREGMRALIRSVPDMELVGDVADGLEAVRRSLEQRPDVILMDLQLPSLSGIEAIAQIKAEWPAARILVITSFGEDENVFAAIKAGALGYLLKDASPGEILRAMRNVAAGQASLQPNIALKVMRELNRPSQLPPTEEPLTPREVEVLRLVARGLSNDDIAGELVVSERTVRTHISNILGKLHLANRTQAALFALRQGIARLDED
jgi:NarL family two-component system response regulator LiaR